MSDSIHPDRARLEALVAFGVKRLRRAGERLDAANCEAGDAIAGLEAANARLAEWIAANPDRQSHLFDDITSEGEIQ